MPMIFNFLWEGFHFLCQPTKKGCRFFFSNGHWASEKALGILDMGTAAVGGQCLDWGSQSQLFRAKNLRFTQEVQQLKGLNGEGHGGLRSHKTQFVVFEGEIKGFLEPQRSIPSQGSYSFWIWYRLSCGFKGNHKNNTLRWSPYCETNPSFAGLLLL